MIGEALRYGSMPDPRAWCCQTALEALTAGASAFDGHSNMPVVDVDRLSAPRLLAFATAMLAANPASLSCVVTASAAHCEHLVFAVAFWKQPQERMAVQSRTVSGGIAKQLRREHDLQPVRTVRGAQR